MLNYTGKYSEIKWEDILDDIDKTYGDKKINIEIKGYRDTRTNQQNKLLWGKIYKEIARETGHTPKDIHWYCKGKFLLDRSGDIPVPKSTTALDTKEFNKYIDKILKWAADFLGLNIQMPDDYDRSEDDVDN